MVAIKRIVISILLVASIALVAGCSPAQTAVTFHKPIEQVTQQDQVNAWNLYVAWITAQREATRDNPTLVCIRGHESANLPNPWAAYNPEGPYYGAYQWMQGSWNSAAAAVGRPDLIGLQPMEPYVAWYDQDSVTLAYHNMVGDGPWGNRC